MNDVHYGTWFLRMSATFSFYLHHRYSHYRKKNPIECYLPPNRIGERRINSIKHAEWCTCKLLKQTCIAPLDTKSHMVVSNSYHVSLIDLHAPSLLQNVKALVQVTLRLTNLPYTIAHVHVYVCSAIYNTLYIWIYLENAFKVSPSEIKKRSIYFASTRYKLIMIMDHTNSLNDFCWSIIYEST